MFKKIISLLLVLVALVQAQIGIEYSAGLNSQYFWRGYDLSESKPVLAPEITLNLGETGIWFDVWAAINADVREIDLTGAYYWELSAATSIDLGMVAYTYPGLDVDPTYELFAAVYGTGLPFEPEFLTAYDFTLKTLYFDLAGSQEILSDRFPLTTSIGLGLYSWDGYSGLSNIRLGVSKAYEVGSLTLTPGLQLNMVPQGFIDEAASGTSSNEIVLSLILGAGGE